MHATFTFAVLVASAAFVSAAPLPDGGSAYTGAGGSSIGGTLSENNAANQNGLAGNSDLLGIASGNAGDGGKATSGTALGGDGATTVSYVNGQPVVTTTNGGSAYSGVGGNTNGGNINTNNNAGPYHNGPYGWGTSDVADNLNALNIAGGNAGDGGDSSSGNAVGGDANGVLTSAYGYY